MRTTGKKLTDLFPGLVRVAGPDDPIYSSGLTMFSVPRSTPSTKTSKTGTAGTSSPHSSAPSGDMSDPKKALSIQHRVDQSLDEGAKERGHVR